MFVERAIGVFDSGVGGLSVLRHVRTLLPHEDLFYVADSAHLPYGGKSPDQVRARVLEIGAYLVGEGVKAIVVACNTATAFGIAELRARVLIPVIGMEPGVKPAAAQTRSGVVGVLATAGTLASTRFQALLHQHAGNARVVAQACPGWVELVESGDWHGPAARHRLHHALRPVLDAGADTLVLGCTHYPFLGDVLAELVEPDVALLDTGAPVARELKRRLAHAGLLRHRVEPGWTRFVSSASTPAVHATLGRLWGAPVEVGAMPALPERVPDIDASRASG